MWILLKKRRRWISRLRRPEITRLKEELAAVESQMEHHLKELGF